MAGLVGTVPNRSAFASFVVKKWEDWMTEAVILHLSGLSIPELRVRYQKTDQHLRNILNTEQAHAIVRKIQAESIRKASSTALEKIESIMDRSLDHMSTHLDNEELRETRPLAHWEHSRKTFETVSKYKNPAPVSTVSIQQNVQNIISASPDLLDRLRSGVALPNLSVPENVEYLGSPPPRETAGAIFGGGVHPAPSESKNGLTLLSAKHTPTP